MIQLKFGKKPATASPKDLRFGDYSKDIKLPTKLPKTFGYGTRFANWGMLGNDEVGDCVIASRAHLTMLETSVGAPATARFTTARVLQTYTDVTGWNPNDQSTDQGTDMRAMCGYQQKQGLPDADGITHKIGAYAALEAGNVLQALQAIFVFGGFCFGFQVPETAPDQFNQGQVWDVVAGAAIVGGHEVCGVGTTDSSARLSVITWGRRQQMTFEFLHTYNDESWVYVSPEILNKAGTFRGFDVAAMTADLAAL